MPDITHLMPNPADEVGTCIDNLIMYREKHRDYMGLSQVGIVNYCPRKAWYMMHGAPRELIEGRIIRLFRSGDNIEDDLVLDMKDIGLWVHSSQKEVVATQGNLEFRGHIDGIIEKLNYISPSLGKKPHLFECKSCNDKRFKQLLKLGDYCEWGGPAYKGQVHIYATLLKIDRIFAVVENKNTSERKFFRFHRDRDFAIETLQKAFEIFRMDEAPEERLSEIPNWYECRFCDYKELCHGDTVWTPTKSSGSW